jgi:hypothetical protein
LAAGVDLTRASTDEPWESSGVDFSFQSNEDTGTAADDGPRHSGLEKDTAARVVVNLVKDSVEYGPTLVVWLFDRSSSAQSIVSEVGDFLNEPYASLATLNEGGDQPRLLTAAGCFGQDVQFLIDPPSPDPSTLAKALDALTRDDSGREVSFSAVDKALRKYLNYRTKQRRELLFIVLTDEAGDDANGVEQLVRQVEHYGVPIYVIGATAPFGRLAALADNIEASVGTTPNGNWRPIRQGPESLAVERLTLGFWGQRSDLDPIDSGFGPFAWERLCRASGGRYLALRPRSDNFSFQTAGHWPSDDVLSFPAEAMRDYAPDYVSPDRYQQLLDGNAARRALIEAAQIPGIDLLKGLRLEFEKKSEALLGRQLSVAQQVVARLTNSTRSWNKANRSVNC